MRDTRKEECLITDSTRVYPNRNLSFSKPVGRRAFIRAQVTKVWSHRS